MDVTEKKKSVNYYDECIKAIRDNRSRDYLMLCISKTAAQAASVASMYSLYMREYDKEKDHSSVTYSSTLARMIEQLVVYASAAQLGSSFNTASKSMIKFAESEAKQACGDSFASCVESDMFDHNVTRKRTEYKTADNREIYIGDTYLGVSDSRSWYVVGTCPENAPYTVEVENSEGDDVHKQVKPEWLCVSPCVTYICTTAEDGTMQVMCVGDKVGIKGASYVGELTVVHITQAQQGDADYDVTCKFPNGSVFTYPDVSIVRTSNDSVEQIAKDLHMFESDAERYCSYYNVKVANSDFYKAMLKDLSRRSAYLNIMNKQPKENVNVH